MSNSKLILGFIAGASVGAIAALLFSPGSGAEIQQCIVDTTYDILASLKSTARDFMNGKKNVTENTSDAYTGSGMRLNTMG